MNETALALAEAIQEELPGAPREDAGRVMDEVIEGLTRTLRLSEKTQHDLRELAMEALDLLYDESWEPPS